MKKLIALFIVAGLLVAVSLALAEKKIGPDCTFKGKQLYGKIQFVDS